MYVIGLGCLIVNGSLVIGVGEPGRVRRAVPNVVGAVPGGPHSSDNLMLMPCHAATMHEDDARLRGFSVNILQMPNHDTDTTALILGMVGSIGCRQSWETPAGGHRVFRAGVGE
jgi:hypothetical protein